MLGGPNGAGKTTAARGVLGELFSLGEFVNADTIATGISGFAPERAAFAAGRIMLARLDELASARADFGFETTMASRSFAPWLADLKVKGYHVNIVFMWLSTPELALRRVRMRVRQGGHDVPAEVVRRRYTRGVSNFVELYRRHADQWRVYDNSRSHAPQLIAQGSGVQTPEVLHASTWNRFLESSGQSHSR